MAFGEEHGVSSGFEPSVKVAFVAAEAHPPSGHKRVRTSATAGTRTRTVAMGSGNLATELLIAACKVKRATT